jgi:hypothetical protein
MKISELLKSGSIARAMEIPVAIAGENRSLTLGQIMDALATAIVPFNRVELKTFSFVQIATGASTVKLPIVFYNGKFYALQETTTTVSGVTTTQAVLYTEFASKDRFYDDSGNMRTDCLFIAGDGRLYRHTGTELISAGLTDAQAEQIKLLTPIPVESEDALAALETAGEIVPGQIYYIPEND